jgi:hypothetical protein
VDAMRLEAMLLDAMLLDAMHLDAMHLDAMLLAYYRPPAPRNMNNIIKARKTTHSSKQHTRCWCNLFSRFAILQHIETVTAAAISTA